MKPEDLEKLQHFPEGRFPILHEPSMEHDKLGYPLIEDTVDIYFEQGTGYSPADFLAKLNKIADEKKFCFQNVKLFFHSDSAEYDGHCPMVYVTCVWKREMTRAERASHYAWTRKQEDLAKINERKEREKELAMLNKLIAKHGIPKPLSSEF